VLSFNREREVETVLQDHRDLITALDERSKKNATKTLRQHLSRIDSIIEEVCVEHADYFE